MYKLLVIHLEQTTGKPDGDVGIVTQSTDGGIGINPMAAIGEIDSEITDSHRWHILALLPLLWCKFEMNFLIGEGLMVGWFGVVPGEVNGLIASEVNDLLG